MRSEKRKRIISVLAVVLVFVLFLCLARYLEHLEAEEQKAYEDALARQKAIEAEIEREKAIRYYENKAAASKLKQKDIYSFLQGPIAWQEKIDWSGKWSEKEVDGNPFGGFGCGLCCMANIYCTLSGNEASPWKVFQFARDNTKYSPNGSVGAIDWPYMKSAMNKMGLTVKLGHAPKTFKKFKTNIKQAKSAICLVSSYNDATFWPSTSGHYVNIWLFNEKKNTVFIAEPGNNVNNRLTIPAEYVYKALKTESDYQVLYVYSYDSSKDKFKPKDGIRTKWKRPKYLKKPANSKY